MPRYVLAQINTTVGALESNASKILAALKEAQKYEPDLVIFPEMTLTGYPPEDLLLKPGFYKSAAEVMQKLTAEVTTPALIGYPSQHKGKNYNTAALIQNGRTLATYNKCLLPNYAVFDEKRYFTEGDTTLNINIGDQTTGVVVCEDAWEDCGPSADCAGGGAQVIACLSASPFHRGKEQHRIDTFKRLCQNNGVYFLYCNLVGGQDELVFDGASFVMNPEGEIIAKAKPFAEDMLVIDLPDLPAKSSGETSRPVSTVTIEPGSANKPEITPAPVTESNTLADVYGALVLGVGDYVRKNGFSGVIIGLSGGIDSALTAAIAVDALGSENVFGVTMPSRYSSGETKDDARILAENLGIRFETLPIEAPFKEFDKLLQPIYTQADPTKDPENLTDQNIQARIRAVYLMALSNKYAMLILNTSNKSESAVGYGTLYGDMAGGFAAIKDVLKTDVWKLSYYVNELHGREVIPVSTITRVPSAELRDNQEDRQSLPDYPVLDPILELFVEQDMTYPEIVEKGHDPQTVQKIIRMVDRSEFKRRQSVIGPRVTPKAFGKDRRLPLTNRF